MRKISSYLYPNRIELLANVAGFTTEYTNVYQRTVKIYKGVDNVIEFDIKNADQKRIDLSENPVLTDLYLNVMDAQGNALPNIVCWIFLNSCSSKKLSIILYFMTSVYL